MTSQCPHFPTDERTVPFSSQRREISQLNGNTHCPTPKRFVSCSGDPTCISIMDMRSCHCCSKSNGDSVPVKRGDKRLF